MFQPRVSRFGRVCGLFLGGVMGIVVSLVFLVVPVLVVVFVAWLK